MNKVSTYLSIYLNAWSVCRAGRKNRPACVNKTNTHWQWQQICGKSVSRLVMFDRRGRDSLCLVLPPCTSSIVALSFPCCLYSDRLRMFEGRGRGRLGAPHSLRALYLVWSIGRELQRALYHFYLWQGHPRGHVITSGPMKRQPRGRFIALNELAYPRAHICGIFTNIILAVRRRLKIKRHMNNDHINWKSLLLHSSTAHQISRIDTLSGHVRFSFELKVDLNLIELLTD